MRLLIAGRQPLFLDGLEALLRRVLPDAALTRSADDNDAVRKARAHAPEVAILDLDPPTREGLGLVSRVDQVAPACRAVLFLAQADEDTIFAAVRLGVRGVLLKSEAPATIVECVRQVHAGGYWLQRQTTTAALRAMVRREAGQRQLARAGLNARELEITQLAGQGVQNVAIGARLRISPATVKIHLHQIYRKLGLSGRIALMGYAREHHLVPPR
ncbi:MAG: response regulator transcription factor [Candidatus Rokubacteria bacterium]|nr:response regulator transcription factor [Candidatus Rokubacteria bacterium]